MRKKKKRVILKKVIVSIFLVIALVAQISFLSYLLKAVAPNKANKKENIIMNYTSSGNVDCDVVLKENEFIDEDSKGSSDSYILDFIDYIKIRGLYNFDSTAKTKVEGTNKLVAKLKVLHKVSSDKSNNPEVLDKEYVLKETVIDFNDKKYHDLIEYDLYIEDYINMVQEFQKQTKIAIDGYLEISLDTKIDGKAGGATYNDSYSSLIKIPLTNSVSSIEKIKSEPLNKNVYTSDIVKTNKKVMGYIVIGNIVIFFILCFLLKLLFKFTNKTEYQKKLEKILNNYDDIIVNTSSMVNIKEYKVIKIDEFKEILNLSRELLLPIMNYEVVKNEETCFYIIKDNIVYAYLIYDKTLPRFKNKS